MSLKSIKRRTERVRLSFHAVNLNCVAGMFEISDPYAVVTLLANETGAQPKILGKTEVINNSLSPHWMKSFEVEYDFSKETRITVNVFHKIKGIDDIPMGNAVFEIGSILGCRGNIRAKKLKQSGTVFCRAKKINESDTSFFHFQLAGVKMKNVDGFFGKSDPYFEIFKLVETVKGNTWTIVHKSEVIMNDLNPKFNPISISLHDLCDNMRDQKLLFVFKDWEKNSYHKPLGSFEASVNDIVKKKWNSTSQNFKKSRYTGDFDLLHNDEPYGGVKILEASIELEAGSGPLPQPQLRRFSSTVSAPIKIPTFMDYLSGGLQLQLSVAIDFTSSNGDPREPGTLHYINQGGDFNDYEKALTAVGGIIAKYDSDQMFTMLGFGAKFDGVVRHCFQLGPTAEVYGRRGMLDAYKNTFRSGLIMSGPTVFEEVIQYAADQAQRNQEAAQQIGAQSYQILLILTNGSVDDVEATKHALEAASHSPLSIVIVGIGEADFSAMQFLDDFQDHEGGRDICQFVEFGLHRNDKRGLTAATLEEIPHQVAEYFFTNGIEPLPPTKSSIILIPEEYSEEGEVDIEFDFDEKGEIKLSGGGVYVDSGYGKHNPLTASMIKRMDLDPVLEPGVCDYIAVVGPNEIGDLIHDSGADGWLMSYPECKILERFPPTDQIHKSNNRNVTLDDAAIFCYPEGCRIWRGIDPPSHYDLNISPHSSSSIEAFDECLNCATSFSWFVMQSNEKENNFKNVKTYGAIIKFYAPAPSGIDSTQDDFLQGLVSGRDAKLDDSDSGEARRLWVPLGILITSRIPIVGAMEVMLLRLCKALSVNFGSNKSEKMLGSDEKSPSHENVSQIISQEIANLIINFQKPIPGVLHCSIPFLAGESLLLKLPAPTGLPPLPHGSSVISVCRLLGSEGLNLLLAAALTESKIIIHSDELANLAMVAEVVTALMYPFVWSYPYIPVLPKSLIEIIEAPVSYIIGTLSCNLELIDDDVFSEIVLIDLDNRIPTPEKSGWTRRLSKTILRTPSDMLKKSSGILRRPSDILRGPSDASNRFRRPSDILRRPSDILRAQSDASTPSFASAEFSLRRTGNKSRESKTPVPLPSSVANNISKAVTRLLREVDGNGDEGEVHVNRSEGESLSEIEFRITVALQVCGLVRGYDECLFNVSPSQPAFNLDKFLRTAPVLFEGGGLTTAGLKGSQDSERFLTVFTNCQHFHQFLEMLNKDEYVFFHDVITTLKNEGNAGILGGSKNLERSACELIKALTKEEDKINTYGVGREGRKKEKRPGRRNWREVKDNNRTECSNEADIIENYLGLSDDRYDKSLFTSNLLQELQINELSIDESGSNEEMHQHKGILAAKYLEEFEKGNHWHYNKIFHLPQDPDSKLFDVKEKLKLSDALGDRRYKRWALEKEKKLGGRCNSLYELLSSLTQGVQPTQSHFD